MRGEAARQRGGAARAAAEDALRQRAEAIATRAAEAAQAAEILRAKEAKAAAEKRARAARAREAAAARGAHAAAGVAALEQASLRRWEALVGGRPDTPIVRYHKSGQQQVVGGLERHAARKPPSPVTMARTRT